MPPRDLFGRHLISLPPSWTDVLRPYAPLGVLGVVGVLSAAFLFGPNVTYRKVETRGRVDEVGIQGVLQLRHYVIINHRKFVGPAVAGMKIGDDVTVCFLSKWTIVGSRDFIDCVLVH